jgi:hypothetical protein
VDEAVPTTSYTAAPVTCAYTRVQAYSTTTARAPQPYTPAPTASSNVPARTVRAADPSTANWTTPQHAANTMAATSTTRAPVPASPERPDTLRYAPRRRYRP